MCQEHPRPPLIRDLFFLTRYTPYWYKVKNKSKRRRRCKGVRMELDSEAPEKMRQNVISRLKRIEGQVRGLVRMVEEGKRCEEILIQVKAVRSALQSANAVILKRYMLTCFENVGEGSEQLEEQQKKLEEMVELLVTFIDK